MKSLKLYFVADVPALGYKTYEAGAGQRPVRAGRRQRPLEISPTRLENQFYVVELDPNHGGVRRVFDKALKTEVLRATEAFGNELWSPSDPRRKFRRSHRRHRSCRAGSRAGGGVRIRSAISGLPFESVISLPGD